MLDFTDWPHSVIELADYGVDEIKGIMKHFKNHFPDDIQDAIIEEWLPFKLKVVKRRTSEPLEVYCSLLLSKPVGFTNMLRIVELMMSLSLSTAKVERGFSEMNIEKNEKRTRMNQNTLQSLMIINTDGPKCDDFQPIESVKMWLNSGPGSRHISGHTLVKESNK